MPRKKQPQVYIATESFWVDGEPNPIIRGKTRVREGHPLLKSHSGYFKPVDATEGFEVEQTTAAPGERRAVSLTTGEGDGVEQV